MHDVVTPNDVNNRAVAMNGLLLGSRLAIVMIICCVTALILKSKAMLPHSELLAMERRIVRKPLIVLLLSLIHI